MRQAAIGDTVRVHYVGTLADGTEFDSSIQGGPIEVTLGGGQVIAGFENALLGMAEGDKKNVTLEPGDAYGPHNDQLVHVVERERLPSEMDLEVGNVIQATSPNGQQMRLLVIELDADSVTLDANHPLAGKALTFGLELVGFVG
jgi:peptidylprolyl isomerase